MHWKIHAWEDSFHLHKNKFFEQEKKFSLICIYEKRLWFNTGATFELQELLETISIGPLSFSDATFLTIR